MTGCCGSAWINTPTVGRLHSKGRRQNIIHCGVSASPRSGNSHEDKTFQEFYSDSSTVVKFCDSGCWVLYCLRCNRRKRLRPWTSGKGQEECLLARGLRVRTRSAESQRRARQRGHHWGMPPGQMWALLCSHSARQQAKRQAQQIGQGVSLTMKYDGLTG